VRVSEGLDKNSEDMKYTGLTEKTIEIFFRVHNLFYS